MVLIFRKYKAARGEKEDEECAVGCGNVPRKKMTDMERALHLTDDDFVNKPYLASVYNFVHCCFFFIAIAALPGKITFSGMLISSNHTFNTLLRLTKYLGTKTDKLSITNYLKITCLKQSSWFFLDITHIIGLPIKLKISYKVVLIIFSRLSTICISTAQTPRVHTLSFESRVDTNGKRKSFYRSTYPASEASTLRCIRTRTFTTPTAGVIMRAD